MKTLLNIVLVFIFSSVSYSQWMITDYVDLTSVGWGYNNHKLIFSFGTANPNGGPFVKYEKFNTNQSFKTLEVGDTVIVKAHIEGGQVSAFMEFYNNLTTSARTNEVAIYNVGAVVEYRFLLPAKQVTFNRVRIRFSYYQYTFGDRKIYIDSIYTAKSVTIENPYWQLPTDLKSETPESFSVSQNYPNPFNPETSINVHLNSVKKVSIEIYNTAGEKIDIIANGEFIAGNHNFKFLSKNLNSGIYFAKIQVGDQQKILKMNLLK